LHFGIALITELYLFEHYL